MTIARAQMYRQLYQMGGIGSLPMDFGQPLEVPQQMPTNFSSAQNITMNPLLNYGQPQLGQAGGTPLTMAGGGITRLGYQEGGMDQMMMEPQMQEQAMMQPQMQQAPEGIMNAMPQEAGGAQQGLSQEKGTISLAVIIKLLIDQGIDPETAKQLAMQILQAFAQGGEAGVEEFANQLEQQEGMQETAMMANGGIMGYAQRQNYGFGSIFKGAAKAVSGVVKGVASAVKSVAKSDIGKIALTAAAIYFGGPMLASSFGISGAAGAAWAGGLANSALQIASGKKFNPLEAIISAGGAYISAGGLSSGAQGTLNAGGAGIPGADIGDYSTLSSGVNTSAVVPPYQSGAEFASARIGDAPNMISNVGGLAEYTDYSSAPLTNSQRLAVQSQQGNLFEKGLANAEIFGTNLINNPVETIGKYATSAYNTVTDNAIPLATGFLAGSALAQQPNESDEAYKLRAQTDPRVAEYITQYGGQAKVYSPGLSGLYSMEKAVDPFAGRSTYVANGGRIGYEYGSMPMGEPRRNQAGIMELDYRAKGGFVPPVGIKEKADDIPAMLSNNEFVFTANAVRNAGGGNVNKGAQKMYGLMKQLEAGGMA